MSIEDSLNYYSNLLIVQYRTKNKAINTVRLLVNQALSDDLAIAEQNCFNLDTAIGSQLDIIAKIVGCQRQLYGVDLNKNYFSFTRYDDTPPSIGFGRYLNDPYINDFLRYIVGSVYTLTDNELRTLIKLKIIFNNTYTSFKNLKEALYFTFSGEIDILSPEVANQSSGLDFFNFTRYEDTPASIGFGRYLDDPYTGYFYRFSNFDNMTLTYRVQQIHFIAFEAARFLNIVPRPMGVMLETQYA